MTTETLLAQAAVDRVTAGAHILIIEGPYLPTTHDPTACHR